MDYPPWGLPPQGGMVYAGHAPAHTHCTLRREGASSFWALPQGGWSSFVGSICTYCLPCLIQQVLLQGSWGFQFRI